jgi:hypothetical protein
LSAKKDFKYTDVIISRCNAQYGNSQRQHKGYNTPKEVHFNCEVAGISTDAMPLYRQSNGSHENCETRLKK